MLQFLNPPYIIAVLIAVSIHEWAHAITAYRFGDPTAEREGRLTINPLAHLDLIGSLMFFIIGFGWAKPVPVNASYFRHPKREMSIVALAGPFSNLVLAFLAFIGLALMTSMHDLSLGSLLSPETSSPALTVLAQILGSSLFVNLGLMAFNLLPIPPLDGSNILRMFIPYHLEHQYDQLLRYGPIILLVLILLPNSLLSGWVFGISGAVLWVFEALVGLVGL